MELNEQSLEKILTRQREEYQRALEGQGDRFDRALKEQGERFDQVLDDRLGRALTEQDDRFGHALKEQGERFDQMLDDRLDRALKEQGDKFQLHMSVQVEALRSDVRLLAEAVSGIQEQLITLRDMVSRATEDIAIMKMEMSIMRSDLKQKVDRDEFSVLEARVAKLERTGRAR
jgi:hypothetical protein